MPSHQDKKPLGADHQQEELQLIAPGIALCKGVSHVMAWLGIVLQGWSFGAGCGYHTSPAYPAHTQYSP